MGNAPSIDFKYRGSAVMVDEVKTLRTQYDLDSLPIDIVKLASKLGITIYEAKFDDENTVGMIVRRGSDTSILVNQDDPPTRKRFTIAHELGHFQFHLPQDGQLVDQMVNLYRSQKAEAENRDWKEGQANMFAAELLMPEAEVRKFYPEVKSIDRLARIFEVSKEAMGFRIASLGL